MSEYRRAFIDPDTLDTLLLDWSDQHQGWIPNMSVMEGWRTGQLRLYLPTDTSSVITMPGHIDWQLMTDMESRDIAVLLAHPWIRDGAAQEGLREEEIDDFDIWRQTPVPTLAPLPTYIPPSISIVGAGAAAAAAAAAPPVHWETIIRPTVSIEEPYTLMPLPAVIREENYFLTALLASQLALSVYSATTTLPPPLPRHVAALVVADAKARDSICPITLESLDDTAAVTSCGHVFQRSALEHWLNKYSTCPECRQPCSVTPAAAPGEK